jgi:hypothetical protein
MGKENNVDLWLITRPLSPLLAEKERREIRLHDVLSQTSRSETARVARWL